MKPLFPLRTPSRNRPFLGNTVPALALLAAALLAPLGSAQQRPANPAGIPSANPAAGSSAPDQEPVQGEERIVLALPFDNLSDETAASSTKSATPAPPVASPANPTQPSGINLGPGNLDWLREAAPEILNSRLTSAGFLPLTREDRLYALDHLGLPETFQPSRATALRIAQTLDANYVIVGTYQVRGSTLHLEARIVDVARLHISDPISETGEISRLIPLLNSLAWQITRKLDPAFAVSEDTFRAAGSNIRLDAFEQYIRGLTEHDPSERLRHLKKATELNPDFTAAWLAMAKLDFANQQYEESAVAFGKVATLDPGDLEAGFYRGLSLIFSGNYPRAEEAFAAVARVLPLPEVVNNQAVAEARRGRDAVNAIALFRQAEAADPNDADYHFNLAVSLHRHGDTADALSELNQSLKLHPADSESKSLIEAWKAAPKPAATPSGNPADPATPEPLERIKRTYDGAAFRQASLMLDQVEASRLAALPGPQRAQKLAASAREKLNRGLLLEAERGFQAALAADPNCAEAKTGLTQVHERAGTLEANHP